MSIRTVVQHGYASGGTIPFVVRRGYSGAAAATTATITGTILNATETDIVAGGKTIIITLANDTWVAAGATFNAQRQAIINGLTSAQSETAGWNSVVRASQGVAGVVRTNSTTVTITLDAESTYNITANETITVTVPSAALVTSLVAVVASPTFTISAVAAPSAAGIGSMGPKEYHIQLPRPPKAKEPIKFKRRTENLDRQDIADIMETLKKNGLI